jgi:hypothetical protein
LFLNSGYPGGGGWPTYMIKNKVQSSSPEPYALGAEERAVIEKAFVQRKIAPAPRLKVEDNKVAIDHPDEMIGRLLIQNALGTLDAPFMYGLLNQLAVATSGGQAIDEADLNFMVSVIKGIEPRDQVEAMLAAQMAGVHMATMRFIQQLPRIKSLPQQDAVERAINKFARTFTGQMEALKRYRTSGEQKVTVQHVSVSEGGQAIVGNVTQNPRQPAPDNAVTHSKTRPMKTVAEAEAAPEPVERKPRK